MKRWRCTVCGYIHEGPTPPEKCPVCGVGAEMFEEMAAEEAATVQVAEEAATPSSEAVMKRWRCKICGYIHDGLAPPLKCPVCGVGAEMFEELVLEEVAIEPEHHGAGGNAVAKPDTPTPYDQLCDLLNGLHAHPISVHVPNGVLPAAVLFMVIAFFYDSRGFSQAAFFNTVFVLLAMPFVIYSGVIAWKGKYSGAVSRNFQIKILCGGIVATTALASVLWMEANPEVLLQPGWARYLFLLINLIMLAAAGIAGHLGGKLVFKD